VLLLLLPVLLKLQPQPVVKLHFHHCLLHHHLQFPRFSWRKGGCQCLQKQPGTLLVRMH
jgi:hypothetical protein